MDCDKSEREVQRADPSHITHLAVDWGRNIEKNEVYNYGHEGCCPREGVELPKAKGEDELVNHPEARLQTQIVHR